ncbi:MAG TPA: hypothetical protein VL793_15455, partial [Patescibacteria group bacterium]|nr:hypothetical protein [Patescibacteria group bacterium]
SGTPTVSHTFLTEGTNWVTLTVATTGGKTASYSNAYRTLKGTNTIARPSAPTGLRIVVGP